jgi:hypothetical protein
MHSKKTRRNILAREMVHEDGVFAAPIIKQKENDEDGKKLLWCGC